MELERGLMGTFKDYGLAVAMSPRSNSISEPA